MTEAPTAGERDERPARRWPSVLSSVATVVALLAVAWFFLGPHITGEEIIPMGADTKKYLWRSNLVIEHGLDILPDAPEKRFWPNPDRPGFPAIAALVHATLGITPFGLAYLFPALTAAALGMAAGAFARRALGEPAWAVPIYVLALGTSLQVAFTASPGGYFDNLQVNPVLMAAATFLIVAAANERGAVGVVLLLAGAALMHWVFASLFVAMVLALAVLVLPATISMMRRGEPFLGAPSVRLGGIAGASVLAGASLLAVAPSFPSQQPSVPMDSLREKTEARIGQFRLALTLPLAGAGAAALVRPSDSPRRWGLLFVGIWALLGPAAYLAYLGGFRAPPYRFMGFSLGIPLLVAAALAGGGRILGRRFPFIAPPVTLAAVVLVLGFLSLRATDILAEANPTVSPAQLAESRTANRYLEAVGGDRPVIFTVTRFSGRRAVNVVRSGLSGRVLPRTVIFFGTPMELYGDEPPIREGNRRFNRQAVLSWPATRAAVQRDPIVVLLPSLNSPEREDPGGFWIGTRALIVEGPEPAGPVGPAPQPRAGPRPHLIATFLGILTLLLAIGGGWAAALLRASPGVIAGVAPALGLALLAIVAVVGNRLGLPPSGGSGVGLVVLAALSGWGLAAWRAVRGRRRAHAEA